MPQLKSGASVNAQGFRLRKLWFPIFCLAVGALSHKLLAAYLSGSQLAHERLKKNSVLLVQQLDSLAGLYLEGSNSDWELSDAKRRQLETWVVFDKRFVEMNRDEPLLHFEVATASRRVGFASLFLGQLSQAGNHLELAIELFHRLEEEYPSTVSYRFDHAATLLQLGQLYKLQGDRPRAIEQCHAALEVLQVEGTLSTGEFVANVGQVLLAISSQLSELGESKQARSILEQNVALLRDGDAAMLNNPVIQQILNDSLSLSRKLQDAP